MSSWPPHLPIAITASRAVERRVADPGPGDGQGRLEGAGGEVGELGGDVVDALVVREVAGREPQQHPAVLHAQRVERLPVGQRRRREYVVGVGADRAQQAGADGERRRAGRSRAAGR